MRHVFEPSVFYNNFGPYEPVLYLQDGDTLVTPSLDARGWDAKGIQRAARGNPLVGPFYIEGAEPGDTLQVDIKRVWPNRDHGWAKTVVAGHVVVPEHAQSLPEVRVGTWAVDIEKGTATLMEPETVLGQITLDLEPMLGCLGVAPMGHQAISSATSAQHGGNMDYRGYKSGMTTYFPVFEPGALLFTGDGHATQGDGEIVGTGIEISMDIELTVHVIKDKTIRWPRGEDADYIWAAGNDRPLDGALQHATSELMAWMRSDYGLDAEAASILLGQCVDYDLGNIFDPAYTMVCKMAKRFLPERCS